MPGPLELAGLGPGESSAPEVGAREQLGDCPDLVLQRRDGLRQPGTELLWRVARGARHLQAVGKELQPAPDPPRVAGGHQPSNHEQPNGQEKHQQTGDYPDCARPQVC
jgi:hypothetical protein